VSKPVLFLILDAPADWLGVTLTEKAVLVALASHLNARRNGTEVWPSLARLSALPASYAMQRRRTYNDRIINTFDGGFVIRYTLHGVQHSGHSGALWICIVGLCRDGKITRIDEYMDSGKFDAWRGGPRPAAQRGEKE